MRRACLAAAVTMALVFAPAAEAAPRPFNFFSNTGWGWQAGVGPRAWFDAFASPPVRIKMTCDAWMSTRGGAIVGVMPNLHHGINYIACPVAGRWVGPRTYTAGFYFQGVIKTPKWSWVPVPPPDPSCKILAPQLLECIDMRRSQRFKRKGDPTISGVRLGYRAVRR